LLVLLGDIHTDGGYCTGPSNKWSCVLMKNTDLSRFSNADFDRGAGRGKEVLWRVLHRIFFRDTVLQWYRTRRWLLKRFGAEIGAGVVVKPRARITFPWRLSVGENAWIGEEALLLSLDDIRIGANVCVSQRAFLCTGNHDWSDPAFTLITEPIVVEDGAWIGANVFVGPGVTIGQNAVATAGSVVTDDLPAGMVCSGNPCTPVKERKLR
jgi:putative colanic acid biosynthesis acetyltransferase WcaF